MSDLDYLKSKCERYDNNFFDEDAMAFFNSRIHDVVRMGSTQTVKSYRVITSERMELTDPLRFTVRHFIVDDIEQVVILNNIGAFRQYETLNEARLHIKDGI